jgi:hypothetical protein
MKYNQLLKEKALTSYNNQKLKKNKLKINNNSFTHRRIYPVPQSITGLVSPGKKNPTIFFFPTYSFPYVTKVLLIQ